MSGGWSYGRSRCEIQATDATECGRSRGSPTLLRARSRKFLASAARTRCCARSLTRPPRTPPLPFRFSFLRPGGCRASMTKEEAAKVCFGPREPSVGTFTDRVLPFRHPWRRGMAALPADGALAPGKGPGAPLCLLAHPDPERSGRWGVLEILQRFSRLGWGIRPLFGHGGDWARRNTFQRPPRAVAGPACADAMGLAQLDALGGCWAPCRPRPS